MTKRKTKKGMSLPQLLLLLLILGLSWVYKTYFGPGRVISLENIPAYSGESYVAINGNKQIGRAHV